MRQPISRRTFFALLAALLFRPRLNHYARPTGLPVYNAPWRWGDDAPAWSRVGIALGHNKWLVTIGYKSGRVERYAARGWDTQYRGAAPFHVPIDGERLS